MSSGLQGVNVNCDEFFKGLIVDQDPNQPFEDSAVHVDWNIFHLLGGNRSFTQRRKNPIKMVFIMFVQFDKER
jgi:hypothetical protein